jgi:hypothetical protein
MNYEDLGKLSMLIAWFLITIPITIILVGLVIFGLTILVDVLQQAWYLGTHIDLSQILKACEETGSGSCINNYDQALVGLFIFVMWALIFISVLPYLFPDIIE